MNAELSEANFNTQTRQLVLKVPFAIPKLEESEMDDVFKDFATEEAEQLKGENLLKTNFKKVQEKQIELKSDLLMDIM